MAGRSLLLALLLVHLLPGQDFTLIGTDGVKVEGKLGAWKDGEVQIGGATVAADKVLFFHGPAPRVNRVAGMIVHLVDGDVVAGTVAGGDEDGEAVMVTSKAVGNLRLLLDSVALVRVKQKDGFQAPERFALASGEAGREALYRWTPIGLDVITGILDRISQQGVHFEWRKENKAELFEWHRIAGLRLPVDPADKKTLSTGLVVLTAGGCRISGRPLGILDGRLRLETRSLGKVGVLLDQIVAGHVLAANRVWLSSLKPTKVVERRFLPEPTFFPFRRDECCLGEFPRVRDRSWTVGLGCHSLSRLSFAVPEGARRFMTWIGADASAVETGRAGSMDFAVVLDGKVVASKKKVKGGSEAMPLPAVNVKPGQMLQVELGYGEWFDMLDRGNWLAPVFLK